MEFEAFPTSTEYRLLSLRTAFPTSIEYRLLSLRTAADVVRFSYIAQKSIHYLDLRLCHNSRFGCFYETIIRRHNDGPRRVIHFIGIDYEDRNRKLFTQDRRRLHALNLDFTEEKDRNLTEDGAKYIRCSITGLRKRVGKITLPGRFYSKMLLNFVQEALKINIPKLKILKWMLKFRTSNVPLLCLPTLIAINFVDCFYPEVTDSELFRDFIMQVPIKDLIIGTKDPKVLEFLLLHARRFGRTDLEEGRSPIEVYLAICVFDGYFSNVGPVLKFINVPKFTLNDYRDYRYGISSRRPALTVEVLEKAPKWIKPKRIHHMLQVIWMYIVYYCEEESPEAMRLLWNTYPDAFISFKELETVFGPVFTVEELEDIYEFYATAVGKFYEHVEPRSLQHLCRTTVRRVLRENRIWIPDGISKMGLAKPFQLFLNLEKSCYPSFH